MMAVYNSECACSLEDEIVVLCYLLKAAVQQMKYHGTRNNEIVLEIF